jgi:hypothetical protein
MKSRLLGSRASSVMVAVFLGTGCAGTTELPDDGAAIGEIAAPLQSTETEGTFDFAFLDDVIRLRSLVQAANSLPVVHPYSATIEAKIKNVETLALATDTLLTTLATKAKQLAEADNPAPLIAGVIQAASQAETKGNELLSNAQSLTADIGDAATAFVALAQAAESAGNVALAEANSMNTAGDALYTAFRVVGLAAASQGSALAAASEARRVATDRNDHLVSVATRLGVFGVAAQVAGWAGSAQADLLEVNGDKLATSGNAISALEEQSAAITLATERQVPRVTARSEVAQKDKTDLQDLIAVEKAAGVHAKTQSDKVKAGASDAETAVKNYGALSGGKRASGEAVATKSDRLKNPAQGTKTDAEAVRGSGASVSKAGSATKGRAEKAKKEDVSGDTKQTLQKLADIEDKAVNAMGTEIDRLRARTDVEQRDKDDLNALNTNAKQSATLSKAEAARAAQETGTHARDAVKNVGGLGHAKDAVGEAVATKGGRIKNPVQDSKTDAEGVRGAGSAAGKSGAAVKTRAEDAKTERETPQTKDTIKQIADANEKVANSLGIEIDRIRTRSDVVQKDKDDLGALNTATKQAATTSKNEAIRATTETGAGAREAIKNAGGLGGAVEGAGEAAAGKGNRIKSTVQDAKNDAEAVRATGKGATKSGGAVKGRVDDAKVERETAQTKDAIKQMADLNDKVVALMATEVDRLRARPDSDVPVNDKNDLNALNTGVKAASSSARTEAIRASAETGAGYREAIKNTGGLAAATDAVGEAMAAKGNRIKSPVQDSRNDAESVRATGKGAVKSGGATKGRANEAKTERETAQTKDAIKQISDLNEKVVNALGNEIDRLVGRADVVQKDKDDLNSVKTGIKQAATTGKTEGARGQTQTGITAREATKNAGGLGAATEGAAEATAAKAERLSKKTQGKKVDAEGVKGVGQGAVKSGAAVKERASDAKNEREAAQTKDTVRQISDLNDRVVGMLGTEIDRLAGRSDVDQQDKDDLNGIKTAIKTASGSGKAEGARSAAETGSGSREAIKNAGGLGAGTEAGADAAAAKAGRVKGPVQGVKKDAESVENHGKAAVKSGAAVKTRATDAKTERETAQTKDTIKQLGEINDKVAAVLGNEIDRLVGRAEVDPIDKTDLGELKTAINDAASRSKAEAERGATETGRNSRDAMKNAGGLGAGSEAGAEAAAAKGTRIKQPGSSVQDEAKSVKEHGGAAVKSGAAANGRVDDVKRERPTQQTKDSVKSIHDVHDRVVKSLKNESDRLRQRADVSDQDKQALDQAMQAAGVGAALAVAEAARGQAATGTREWMTAAKNANTAAAAASALSAVAAAIGERVGDEKGATWDNDVKSARASAEAATIAASAAAGRASEAKQEAAHPKTKEAVQAVTDAMSAISDTLTRDTERVKTRAEVSAQDKQSLDDLAKAVKKATDQAKSEAQRAAQQTGPAWNTATNNAGVSAAASGAAASAASAVAERAADDKGSTWDLDVKSTRKTGEAASKAGKAQSDRAREAKEEFEEAATKATSKAVSEVQSAISDVLTREVGRVKTRTEVSAADKQSLDELAQAVKKGADRAKAEATRAEAATGADFGVASNNAGAASGAASAAGEAVAAVAERVGDEKGSAWEADVKSTRKTGEAGGKSGVAQAGRAAEAKGEPEHPKTKETIKEVSSIHSAIVEVLVREVGRVKTRAEVSAADKQSLDELSQAAKKGSDKGKAEGVRGEAQTGVGWNSASNNVGANGGASGAAAEATAAIGERVAEEKGSSWDVDVKSTRRTAEASSKAGVAQGGRAIDAKSEPEDGKIKETMKAVSEINSSIAEVLIREVGRVKTRAEVSAQDKQSLDEVSLAVKKGADKGKAEATRGAQSGGSSWNTATNNAGVSGAASSAAADAAAAVSERVAEEKGSSWDADVKSTKKTGDASAKAGVSQWNRATEAKNEQEHAKTKETIKAVAEINGTITDVLIREVGRVKQRPEVSAEDKQSLDDISQAVKKGSDKAKAEATRGETTSGAAWNSASNNAGASGAAAGAAGQAMSAVGERIADELGSSWEADVTSTKKSGDAGVKSGAATWERATEAKSEPEDAKTKETLRDVSQIHDEIVKATVREVGRVKLRPEVSTDDKQSLDDWSEAARETAQTGRAEAERGVGVSGAGWNVPSNNTGASGAISGSASNGVSAVAERVGNPRGQSAAGDANAAKKAADAIVQAGAAVRERAEDAQTEAVAEQTIGVVKVITRIKDKIADQMKKESDRVKQRPEVPENDKQQLEQLANAVKQAAAAAKSESDKLTAAQIKSKLERIESLAQAASAVAEAVKGETEPLTKPSRDEKVDLDDLDAVAGALEKAAASAASQAKFESKSSDPDPAGDVMKALANAAKAAASAQLNAAARIPDNVLIVKLAAGAKKAADKAAAKAELLDDEQNKKANHSKVGARSGAAKSAAGGVKSEVDRKRKPNPDKKTKQSRVKALAEAAEAINAAITGEVRGQKKNSGDATSDADLVRSLSDALQSAADKAQADSQALFDEGDATVETLKQMTQGTKSVSARIAAAAAALQEQTDPDALDKLFRLIGPAAGTSVGAAIEAERLNESPDDAPATLPNTTKVAGGVQAAIAAVAAEALRLRKEALPAATDTLAALNAAAQNAAARIVAEALLLEAQDAAAYAALKAKAQQVQAAMGQVAAQVAALEQAQGNSAEILFAIDQLARAAQAASVEAAIESAAKTVGSGSVASAEANLAGLVAAARSNAVSTAVEAQRALLDADDYAGTVVRMKAAAGATKSSALGSGVEAERLATSLSFNASKAQRLLAMTAATSEISQSLVDKADEIAAATGEVPELLFELDELATDTHGKSLGVGTETVQLKKKLPSAAPKPQPSVSVTYNLWTDWSTGYCVGLNIQNPEQSSTASWLIEIDIDDDVIYDPWNANFTAYTGRMTLTPLYWNTEIEPGETNVSVGFCANRPITDGSLPIVVRTAATFE